MNILRLRTPAGRQDRTLTEKACPAFKALFGESGKYVVNMKLCPSESAHQNRRHPLSYESFQSFRNKLRDAVLEIQFRHYDLDNSCELSPREFGMFLVTHAKQVLCIEH